MLLHGHFAIYMESVSDPFANQKLNPDSQTSGQVMMDIQPN